MLIHLYSSHMDPNKANPPAKVNGRERPLSALPNGHANGHIASERQLRDAQEFELEALMSDEEEPDTRKTGAGHS